MSRNSSIQCTVYHVFATVYIAFNRYHRLGPCVHSLLHSISSGCTDHSIVEMLWNLLIVYDCTVSDFPISAPSSRRLAILKKAVVDAKMKAPLSFSVIKLVSNALVHIMIHPFPLMDCSTCCVQFTIPPHPCYQCNTIQGSCELVSNPCCLFVPPSHKSCRQYVVHRPWL